LRAALLRLLEATHGKFQCPSLVVSLVRLAGVATPAPSPGVGHGPSASGTGMFSTPMFGGGGDYGSGALASVGPEELDALRCLLGAGLAVEDVLTLPVRVGLLSPDLAAMQSSLLRLVNRTASRALFDAESTLELSRELSTTFITKLLGPRVGDGVAAGDAPTVVGHQVGRAGLRHETVARGESGVVVLGSRSQCLCCFDVQVVEHLCRGGQLAGVEAHILCASIVRPDWRGRSDLCADFLKAITGLDSLLCSKRCACTVLENCVLGLFVCGEMCGRTWGCECSDPLRKGACTLRLIGFASWGAPPCCGQVVFRVSALCTRTCRSSSGSTLSSSFTLVRAIYRCVR
jgi:hypothetical protein